jgi:hypothetical protein
MMPTVWKPSLSVARLMTMPQSVAKLGPEAEVRKAA